MEGHLISRLEAANSFTRCLSTHGGLTVLGINSLSLLAVLN